MINLFPLTLHCKVSSFFSYRQNLCQRFTIFIVRFLKAKTMKIGRFWGWKNPVSLIYVKKRIFFLYFLKFFFEIFCWFGKKSYLCIRF